VNFQNQQDVSGALSSGGVDLSGSVRVRRVRKEARERKAARNFSGLFVFSANGNREFELIRLGAMKVHTFQDRWNQLLVKFHFIQQRSCTVTSG